MSYSYFQSVINNRWKSEKRTFLQLIFNKRELKSLYFYSSIGPLVINVNIARSNETSVALCDKQLYYSIIYIPSE